MIFGRQRYTSAISCDFVVSQGILLFVVGAFNESASLFIISGTFRRQNHGWKLFLVALLKEGTDCTGARISDYNGAKIMFFSVRLEQTRSLDFDVFTHHLSLSHQFSRVITFYPEVSWSVRIFINSSWLSITGKCCDLLIAFWSMCQFITIFQTLRINIIVAIIILYNFLVRFISLVSSVIWWVELTTGSGIFRRLNRVTMTFTSCGT